LGGRLFLGVVFLCFLAVTFTLSRPLKPDGFNIESSEITTPVNHIELEIVNDISYPKHPFETSHVSAHGFHEVDFRGYRYTLEGRDVVLKRPISVNAPPRYQVLVKDNLAKIIDLNSQKKLLSFYMSSDSGLGYLASKQLASIFKPDYFPAPKKSNTSQDHSSVDMREPTAVIESNERSGMPSFVYGCPAEYEYVRGSFVHGVAEIRTPHWTLLPIWGLEEVVCTPHGVLVFAQNNQEDLGVRWISYEGKLVGSTGILNRKMHLRYNYHQTKILSARFTQDSLIVERAYFQRASSQAVKATHEVVFSIPLTQLRVHYFDKNFM
jgi:hypothetical protein